MFAVFHNAFHGYYLQPVFHGEIGKFTLTHHFPVFPEDFAAQPAFFKAGYAHQVHGSFRMPPAFHHSARPGFQRKHVSGTAEVLRFRVWVRTFHGRYGAFRRRDSGSRGYMVYRDGKCRAMVVRIFPYHRDESKSDGHFPAHGHADQSFSVCRHEVHIGCTGVSRGTDQVSFVFPFRIVGHDDYFSLLQVRNGFFYSIESDILLVFH